MTNETMTRTEILDALKARFEGEVVKFNAIPYTRGSARIVDISLPKLGGYGAPIPNGNGYRVVLETIEATETSRLFTATSTKPLPAGTEIVLFSGITTTMLENGYLRYTHSV